MYHSSIYCFISAFLTSCSIRYHLDQNTSWKSKLHCLAAWKNEHKLTCIPSLVPPAPVPIRMSFVIIALIIESGLSVLEGVACHLRANNSLLTISGWGSCAQLEDSSRPTTPALIITITDTPEQVVKGFGKNGLVLDTVC